MLPILRRTVARRPALSLRPLKYLQEKRTISDIRINNIFSLFLPREQPTMPDARPSFQDLFALSGGEHENVWKSLWDSGTYHYWDRGEASPSLVDFIREHPDLIQPSSSSPLTALVPGCGRGHDVHLFGALGIKAYGLELTESATAIAREFEESRPLPPSPGSRTFITGDFFANDWLDNLDTQKFDIMYDYTFMVALDPSKGLREKWADRVAGLIKPGGVLICLEFPLYKAYDLPGPPWAIRSETYVELLENAGFERVYHVKPSRYLPAGKDSDMISAWRRK
ncbi:hypothetical protein ABW19_dt0206470 [Dactylella cylindrospora]|nr:hypothetical protein ABW19_dt0206470 [Dactylella cylindrospora]